MPNWINKDQQPPAATEREAFYDEHIAPLLRQAAALCVEKKMSFVALVEFEKGGDPDIGRTYVQAPDQSLAMTMAHHCAKMNTNLDGYVMGIARYCKENNIPTTDSFVMNLYHKI